MIDNLYQKEAKKRFDLLLEWFKENLKTFRTGRANPSILNSVKVEAYGSIMPLVQVASISVADSHLLNVTPFDPNNLTAIISAIKSNQELGLNPSDDGRIIRVPIPPLTEDRRKELARQISQKVEETLIKSRNIRHEILNNIDKDQKNKIISEDESKRGHKDIEDEFNSFKIAIESLASQKEQEILTL